MARYVAEVIGVSIDHLEGVCIEKISVRVPPCVLKDLVANSGSNVGPGDVGLDSVGIDEPRGVHGDCTDAPSVMILVVVAALPVIVFAGLAREERSLGRKWLARGILASSFVAGAALAAGTVPLIAAIAGDAEPAAVRLHNATDHDNYLVTPLTQPTERSAAHYRRIPPRDHGYPNDRRDRDTNWQTCLTDSPGTVLTLADNYTPVRYRDPQTGQHLSQDPPASAVLSEVQLPAGVCFEDRDPWLGFDGTTVTSIEDPRRGFVHYAIATIAVIATILATTDAIDRSVERLRPRA